MTSPLPSISDVDPYTGLPVGSRSTASQIVEGDAQMQTRTDLGCAQGGEPSDSKEWLQSLYRKHGPGPCAFCGQETTRRIAVEARQLKGRIWGLVTRYECQSCSDKIAELKAAS